MIQQDTAFWSKAFIVVVLAVTGLSVWVRLEQLSATMALQDTVGPFLAALRLDGRPHAPAYGSAILVPYFFSLRVSGGILEAVGWLAIFHALVAPVGAMVTRQISPNRWLPALVVGTVLALEPGLLDTAKSGAEGYLAAPFLGLALLSTGGWAWLAFAFAVANHPLAFCALPVLIRHDTKSVLGPCAAVLMIGTQISGWGSPGVADAQATVWNALTQTVETGGLLSIVILFGPLVGIFHHKTRPLALRVLISGAILAAVGFYIGYLRDHHIRLLFVPAMACWAMAGTWFLSALPVGFALWPQGADMPPDVRLRPGTVGLTDAIGDHLEQRQVSAVVDRMWVSGGPAVEPSAVMLDLYLRGRTPQLPAKDSELVIITSATDIDSVSIGYPGTLIMEGYGFKVSAAHLEEVKKWSSKPCQTGAKPGGAWDAMSVFYPGLKTTDLEGWWACS